MPEKRSTKRKSPIPFSTMISQFFDDEQEPNGWIVAAFDVYGKEIPRLTFYAETSEGARIYANAVLDKAHSQPGE